MANTRNATYVAISATDRWFVSLIGERGESPDSVEARAREKICNGVPSYRWDIWTQTAMKNLTIMSLSAARRAYPNAIRRYEERFEEDEAMWLYRDGAAASGVYVGRTSNGKYDVYVPQEALDAEYDGIDADERPDADDWAADFNDRDEAILVEVK